MGNAPPTGLEYVFREKNATNDFDILVMGLQEATWSATDCIKELSSKVQEIVGEKYFMVSRIMSIYFIAAAYAVHVIPVIILGQARISCTNAVVCFREEIYPIPHLGRGVQRRKHRLFALVPQQGTASVHQHTQYSPRFSKYSLPSHL